MKRCCPTERIECPQRSEPRLLPESVFIEATFLEAVHDHDDLLSSFRIDGDMCVGSCIVLSGCSARQ